MAECKATRTVTVVNREGLHLRAVSLLVNLARRYKSSVSVSKENHVVDGKSAPLQLLSLGAYQGDTLILEATGEDAEEAMDALAHLFASHFGEDDIKASNEEEVGHVRTADKGSPQNGMHD